LFPDKLWETEDEVTGVQPEIVELLLNINPVLRLKGADGTAKQSGA
jgi:hypothetical protein